MKYISFFAQEYKIDTRSLPKPTADPGRLDMIISTALGFLGVIAILVIVFAGLKYILSRGDPREMAQAKNTIIYALIGLGICISAYAIVKFVARNI